VLLYGPPGTGKTLMAKIIPEKVLGVKPDRIKHISGPEVLNKFIGESENNVRMLFKDAEDAWAKFGDKSPLYVIIMDEIEALCRQRQGKGTVGSQTGDNIVNTLLTKLDGLSEFNNILFIGITNRKDLIDDALLRSGRIDIHMYVGLPHQKARLEILEIQTKDLNKKGLLGDDIDLVALSHQTPNFTGADLKKLVRTAVSQAMSRNMSSEGGGA